MKNRRTLIVFAAILAMAAIGALAPGEGSAAFYSLSPTDDALVKATDPNLNTGWYNWLSTNSMNGGFIQRSYLKFDLTGIAAGEAIVGAKLYLYMYEVYGSNFHVALNHVADDSWNEESITWNNKRVYGNQLDRETAALQWGEWDLFATPGAWNPTADLSDGFLSLLLKHETESSSDALSVTYLSKEWIFEPQNLPYLTVETSVVPLPPSILLFGSGLLGTIFVARRRPRR